MQLQVMDCLFEVKSMWYGYYFASYLMAINPDKLIEQGINISLIGNGTVTSNTIGIDFGITCKHNFTAGNLVTLTATPDVGEEFLGWEGDIGGANETGNNCPTTNNTCIVYMEIDRNITARFSSTGTSSTSEPTTPSEVDLSPLEQNSNHTTYFLLQISSPLPVTASVDYITQDDTAIAGQDYIPTSGTATITAGETSAAIGVEIIGDTIAESDEIFKLIISNPQEANFPAGTTEISASKTIVNDD